MVLGLRNPIRCFRNHETAALWRAKIERPSFLPFLPIPASRRRGGKDADFSLHRSIYPNASGPAKTCLASLRRETSRNSSTGNARVRTYGPTWSPNRIYAADQPLFLSPGEVPPTRTRCNAALISISRRGKTWGWRGDTPDSARSRGRATKRWRRTRRRGIRNAKAWNRGNGCQKNRKEGSGAAAVSTQHRRKGKKLKRSWNTRTRFFFWKKIARNTSFVLVPLSPGGRSRGTKGDKVSARYEHEGERFPAQAGGSRTLSRFFRDRISNGLNRAKILGK